MSEKAGWDAFNKAMNEKYQACLDQGRSGCANAMLADWEKELNVVYKKLMAELDTTQQSALRASQRAWLVHREKEVAFLDGLVDVMAEGTILKDQTDDSVLDVTRSRVQALHALLMFELYREEGY